MEKINSEELKNLLGAHALSDDELEKVSGGGAADFLKCRDSYMTQGYSIYQATSWCQHLGGGF